MDARFLPVGFDDQLSHVIEECGEVLAAAGKLQRFGKLSTNPLLPVSEQETNIVWLHRELTDAHIAISKLLVTIVNES